MKDKICKFVLAVGFALLAAAFAAPETAAAAETEMVFNQFRIKSADTGDIVLWGEDYVIDDGDPYTFVDGNHTPFDNYTEAKSVTASISFRGTVYIQIDILSKMCDIYALLNGESNTVTVLRYDPASYNDLMGAKQFTELDSTEIADDYGYTWKYSIQKANDGSGCFIVAIDATRGFSYAYQLAGEDSYEFSSDGVYITKYGDVPGIRTLCRSENAAEYTGDYNCVRINSASGTLIELNESYTLADGSVVPISIKHDGVLYFQIDVFSQLFDMTVLWNGDSSTITFLDFDPSGANGDAVLLDSLRMPDSYGNIWSYNVFEHNDTESQAYYMVIFDNTRGFSRAYRLAGEKAYEFREDRVYLAKLELFETIGGATRPLRHTTSLLKASAIPYENTIDSQDGDEWVHHFDGYMSNSSEVLTIENGTGYFLIPSNYSGHVHYELDALDFETDRITQLADIVPRLIVDNINGDIVVATGLGYFDRYEKIEDSYLYFGLFAHDVGKGEYIGVRFKVKIDGTEEPVCLGIQETTKKWN